MAAGTGPDAEAPRPDESAGGDESAAGSDEPRPGGDEPSPGSDGPIAQDDDEAIPQDDPPHPSDAIYADGPATGEIRVSEEEIRQEAEELAEQDAKPDPVKAAEPDDVIRQPDDIKPDTAANETGQARRVGEDGETQPMAGGEERPSPKAALVYNPIKVDAETLRASVTSLAAEAGWQEPLFYETTVDDLGDDVTRQALEVGVDAVLVAGGDGTVRAVAEAMSGSGVPLTIVPSGTGNLLARNLRLPLDNPETMIRATFDGDTLPVDVGFAALRRSSGKTDEHAFVVMGGMGVDAAMIANTNSTLKKSVGWVAYVDGAARSLPKAKPFRIMYQIAGHRLHAARVQSVLFANCGSLPAGLELIPEASVTDGSMDIVIFQPKGPLGWIFVWRRVAWDNSVLRKFRAGRRALSLRTRDNAVRYARGAEVEVGTSEEQHVQLDGDEFGEAVSIRARVVPAGLTVAIPKGHDVSGL
jgi:diacylglycerol kinase family enzyme